MRNSTGRVNRSAATARLAFAAVLAVSGGQRPAVPQASRPPGPPPPETSSMAGLKPEATFTIGGDPDWMTVTDHAVWVSVAEQNRVVELKAATNSVGTSVPVGDPCSGLAAGFGSLWIPSCGKGVLVRAELATGRIEAAIRAAPADSEGCVAVGAGSVWLATGGGVLSRIDPLTNRVARTIRVPGGSFCPVYAGGFVWLTSSKHSLLAKIDPATNRVVLRVAVGPGPRFATAGGGAIWTLNQGDGSISRVDLATGKLVASSPAGLPGKGGEIAFGFDAVWATLIGTPITRIDPASNAVVRRRTGKGGDSIRTRLGSVWLTDLKSGLVWRIAPEGL
jgi:virginiamycin B lyase